jgi:DNA-3-methyladenine glycosylase
MARVILPEEISAMRTVPAAKWLLGKFLVRRREDGTEDARMITEVEAYDGESDLACHARAGRTARTAPLYEAGGIWYVYLCYGIHEMLNLVVGPKDWPAAVLIRGVEGLHGPGRVTKTLGINRRLNTSPAAPQTGLWLEDREVKLARSRIQATPRIGVDYAGIIWSKKPWRFVVTG